MVMDAETTKKVTERAKERLDEQQQGMDEERLHKLRKTEVAAAENFTAMQRADGREQVLSNLTRIGLFSAIRESSKSETDSQEVAERVAAKVVPETPGARKFIADVLLLSKVLVNRQNARLLLRLVTALPPDSFGKKILVNFMCTAAEA